MEYIEYLYLCLVYYLMHAFLIVALVGVIVYAVVHTVKHGI